jgi:hypothetical protein
VADHVTPDIKDREFDHYPPIPTGLGDEIRVYESSTPSGPRIWLATWPPDNAPDPTSRPIKAVAHLSAEEAVQLAEQLLRLAADQGVARSSVADLRYDAADLDRIAAAIATLARDDLIPELTEAQRHEIASAACRSLHLTLGSPSAAGVDAGLRAVITFLDYDLHKSVECDEETGEDRYGDEVERFLTAYREAVHGE